MSKGVLLIKVKDNSVQENPYRLGPQVVITVEAAQRIFPSIGSHRACFVEESAWEKIGLPNPEPKED